MNSATLDLDPQRWQRAQALFDAAVVLEPRERRAYIKKKCIDDPALCDYVIGLLGVDDDVGDAVARTIVDAVDGAFGAGDARDDDMAGEMLGAWRIERTLGAGGMGTVYLAQRADRQFDQQVAIKLGRHRLVDPQTRLRLENERQILADLDHPNIAQLYDGGTTKDGVPYLVLEYIDGVRIDTYCDVNRLAVTERLQLFCTICSAVHYAHQNLVIHRDIKPSNILVTGNGTPKLLDFGIAKLTDEQGTGIGDLTREGAVILTPEGAAPEQILGRAVTTATDVYALGNLLYVLLAGLRPLDLEGLTPAQFAQVILHEEPERPSERLRRLAGARDAGSQREVADIAADRSTGIDRLQRRLRGDLDTIVLNALRKSPTRRYPSVAALAADIDLHRRSMPIVARSDTWRYRAQKFVRRHVAAVTVAGLVAVMLVTFSVALSIQNRRITIERDTARQVSQFLEEIFEAPDPAQSSAANLTAEDILAAGAARIDAELAGQPAIQATLMGTIGRVYHNLGSYELSESLLRRALELRRELAGREAPATADAANDYAEVLIRLGDYDGAESLLDEALTANEAALGATSMPVATNYHNLGQLHLATGELPAAEANVLRAIGIRETLADDVIALAESRNLLARIVRRQGDLERAERLLQQAIDTLADNGIENHFLMAYYLQNLGGVQRDMGRLDAAQQTLDRAIAATRIVLGEDHSLYAATLVDQVALMQLRGEIEPAMLLLNEALTIHQRTRGPQHLFVGYDLTLLGMLQHDGGHLDAAAASLRRALALFESALGPDNQYVASALTELGAVLNSSGHSREALALLERAMQIRLQDHAPDHELVAATQTEYADTLTRLGRLDEAAPLLDASRTSLGNKSTRRAERLREAVERHAALVRDAERNVD